MNAPVRKAVEAANQSMMLGALHRWFTVLGVPIALGLLGWAALTADQVRQDVTALKVQMMAAQRSLDSAYSSTQARDDFAQRDTRINGLDVRIGRVEQRLMGSP